MLVLDQEAVNNVFNYLNDQPAKFSNPLLNFFNTQIQQQEAERKAAAYNTEDGPISPYLPDEEPVLPVSVDPSEIDVVAADILSTNDPIDD